MPGFTPPANIVSDLKELNSTYRFSARGSSHKQNEYGAVLVDPSPSKQPFSIAEIIDLTTGEKYAEGRGSTEPEALAEAVTIARTATKPLTPAQKADPNFLSQADRIAKLEAELAATKAKLYRGDDKGDKPPPDDQGGKNKNR